MAAEVTDRISAGANVAAAIGTVGALWLGAITLRQQVKDQIRQQAPAVTVGSRRASETGTAYECFISNGSELPICSVRLVAKFDENEADSEADVVEPGGRLAFPQGGRI